MQTKSRETTVALKEQVSAEVLSMYLSLAAHAVIPKTYVDRKRPVAVSSRASGDLLFDGLERIVFFSDLSVLSCATRYENILEDLHGVHGRCKVFVRETQQPVSVFTSSSRVQLREAQG